MKRFLLGTIRTGIAVLAIGASPAFARQKLSPTPDTLSIQAMHNFAGCVVTYARKGAVELLAMDYATDEYRKKMSRLTHGTADSCGASFTLASSGFLLAGAIAERLLTEQANGDQFLRAVAYDPSKPDIIAHGTEEVIGICLSRAAPKESWALLTSEPASDAEGAAINAITPSLGGCVAAGKSIKMNRPALRAIIALGAYQLEHPSAVASAVKGS